MAVIVNLNEIIVKKRNISVSVLSDYIQPIKYQNLIQ